MNVWKTSMTAWECAARAQQGSGFAFGIIVPVSCDLAGLTNGDGNVNIEETERPLRLFLVVDSEERNLDMEPKEPDV